jgi:copper transport protein
VFLRFVGLVAALALALVMAVPADAHANLTRSFPTANSTLSKAPAEIRLWFTEPLEPRYSRITLLNTNGDDVSTAPSLVDPADSHQMALVPGELPDGVYTVSWRTLSSADGHVTQGSFTFGVGMPAPSASAAPGVSESAPAESVIGRWLNLAALSLYMGSLGFRLFVWRPTDPRLSSAAVRRRLRWLTWAGWLLVAAAQVFLLAQQTASAADALTPDAVGLLLLNSTYGGLWLARAALWLLSGLLLARSSVNSRLLWVAFVLGAGLLYLHSLSSHAAAAPDAAAAVAHDGLHLLASCLWLGGLVAFALALVRTDHTAFEVGALVGWFSNYARITVVVIAVTGAYAAWLHVGSWEALVETVYGRALLLKLAMFVPLIVVAGVNLVLTQRALLRGQRVWIGRLRGLIGVEVSLLAGILLAAGTMTALNPARGVVAAKEAVASANALVATATPYFDMQSDNNLMAHLEIVPGQVGENTFSVSLIDEVTGEVVDDASLIRLRFDNREQNVGQSELRPQAQENSIYSATGSNLSLPGEWRIRMTVQRPGEFDSVIDFEAEISAAPAPPVVELDLSIPALERGSAALLLGVTLLVVGGFVISKSRLRGARTVLVAGVELVAVVSLVTGAHLLIASGGAISVFDAWTRPAPAGETSAIYLTIENQTADSVRLLEATTSAAERVELHQTVVEDNVARMEQESSLTVEPGATAHVEPLGMHLMLFNLNADLEEGMTFPLSLTFSSGETLTVNVQVRMNAPTSPLNPLSTS